MADLQSIWDRVKAGGISVWDGIRQYGEAFSAGVKEKGLLNWAIVEPFLHAMSLFGEGLDKTVRSIMPNVFKQADDLAAKNPVETIGDFADRAIEKLGAMSGLSADAVNQLKASIAPLDGAAPIVQVLYIVFSYMSTIGIFKDLGKSITGRELNQNYRPGIPSGGEVMGARGLDPDLDKRIWQILSENGIRDKDIEVMFAATYARLPVEYVRSVFYREGKTPEWAMHRLNELGFTPERATEVVATWPIIPGVQDLVMMQAKEAFEPDQIAKFGLGAEAPTEIYEFTRKLGLPDEWTNRYWTSHWEHPSYGQVMEMLHRGYISFDDVYEWFRLVEIPPYWRELLTKIAYSPYTRVDVRRMHAAGVLTDDDLIQAMKDIGYDQEHAEKMAEFYKRYNAGSEKELSRSDIEKAYEDRDLSLDDAISLLMMIGYSRELAHFYLARIDAEIQRAIRLERIDLIKEKYLANLINIDQARNDLIGSGVTIERTNELLQRWAVQIIKNAKLPSKTDLDKFVRAKVLDQQGYRSEMLKLGYSEYYIGLYWQTIESGGT